MNMGVLSRQFGYYITLWTVTQTSHRGLRCDVRCDAVRIGEGTRRSKTP
jgi:hypothetical protein